MAAARKLEAHDLTVQPFFFFLFCFVSKAFVWACFFHFLLEDVGLGLLEIKWVAKFNSK